MFNPENAISFNVSAPGKMTLFGEHAYMCDSTSTIVAASVDMRTKIAFTEIDENSNTFIRIKFSRTNRDIVMKCPSDEDKSNREAIIESFSQTIQQTLLDLQYPKADQIKIRIFHHLFEQIVTKEQIDIKPFKITVSSMLPENESLGLSTSIAVCFAACLLHWSRLQKGIESNTFGNDYITLIEGYSKTCEIFIYEYDAPIIVDSTVCTYGSMIELKEKKINILKNVSSIKVMLIDTKRQDTVEKEIKKLDQFIEWFPEIIKFLVLGLEAISKTAVETLNNIGLTEANETSEENKDSLKKHYDTLNELIKMNHQFIRTFDVSNEALNTIVTITQNFELQGKYTDGQRGRYAYILLRPETTDEDINNLKAAFIDLQYNVMIANAGCQGVTLE